MSFRRWFAITALGAGLLVGCAHTDRVGTLARQLHHRNPQVRIRSANALAALGPAAAAAQKDLLDALRDGRRAVTDAAKGALAAQGETAVDALVQSLRDPDAWFRSRVVDTLGTLGPAAARAVAPLVAALDDHDIAVHTQAIQALGEIGEAAAPALLEALKHENTVVRQGAAQALERMGDGVQRRVGAALLPDFRSKDAFKRGEAAILLGSLGRLAIPPLLSCIADPDADLRFKTVVALGEIGLPDPAVIHALIGRFQDPDRTVRLKASVVLGRLGTKDGAVLEKLMPLLNSPDAAARRGAIGALGDMGVAGEPALPALVKILASGEEAWRDDVLEALMNIGTTATMAVAERYTRPAR